MDEPVFISYAHEDEEFVLRLARDLEARGTRVWIDRGGIHAGKDWRRAIDSAIINCTAFLFVVSSDSVGSREARRELDLALEKGKPIVQLQYRRVSLRQSLTLDLQALQHLDFRKGGYAQNLADLVISLADHGVSFPDAPEIDPQRQAERRRQRLGIPVRPRWRAVASRVPGWALAWGLGWGIYGLVLPFLLLLFGATDNVLESVPSLQVATFLGGLGGGTIAGAMTMLVLRQHAISIAWRHMAASIWIWGVMGPIGSVIAGALAIVGFNADAIFSQARPDCSDLGIGECLGQSLGHALGASIASVFVLIFLVLGYVLIALFLTGVAAGLLAVRHIRKLEPGILGRQAIRVVLGWGVGSVTAAVGTFIVLGVMNP